VFERGGAARRPSAGFRPRPEGNEAPRPLTADPTVGPLDATVLASALAAGGAVASRLPDYEERPEQLAMVRAVSAALSQCDHLVVEAGTGTGKSLAYLLPAVQFAVATGRRVVVSTNTINLQDQLVQKDLPTLAAALPFPFRVALVKGRSNYLCLRRWQLFLAQERYSQAEARLGIKIAIWLEHTRTGDRAELRLTGDEAAAWSLICALPELCTPARCTFHRAGVCFLARARAAAESSHVVVVNHALLLSDVATRSKVLPDYRQLVVDEAHHLEDEATEQLGVRLTERELRQALDRLQQTSGGHAFGILSDVAAYVQRSGARPARVIAVVERAAHAEAAVARARAALQDLFTELHAFAAQQQGRENREYLNLRLTPAVRSHRDWQIVERGWESLRGQWVEIERWAAELLADLEGITPPAATETNGNAGPEDVMAAAAAELAAELEAFIRLAEGVEAALERIVAAPERDEVYWINVQSGGELSLHLAPLHVGTRLWEDLFSRKDTVVVTSATLTTQESFAYIRERLGLRDGREVQLGSPFDYRSAALLYVPYDVPEPGQPYYQHHLVEVLIALVTALGGRTLVLFTSHGQLRQTHEALRGPLDAQRIVLLGQNIDGSRARLLETFRSGPRVVLLGTSSFWEGVDVVGDALSCLVIARLPFTVPTDPVFAARSELFDEPFREFAVPQAILRFRQGFGRLIRSRGDRGVVAVLDRRLQSKRYGRAFLESLPDCTVRVVPAAELPAQAEGWLAR
jgi:DNA polymerase-3 subunit epsilon/ATP-dependent DNA helicase DinG